MKRSNADIVLDAIQDLHAQEQVITREVLAEVTELKLTVIDDRLNHLSDHGLINRIQRGVYVPAPQHEPARIITRSLCPDGSSVLEIGDQVIVLTPREARMLGQVMGGDGQQFAAIELGHQATNLANNLSRQVDSLGRRVAALRKRGGRITGAELQIVGEAQADG